MGVLYGYLLLSFISLVVITHGWVSLESGSWYITILVIGNVFALPWWIAEVIKAIKELEVNNDKVK